MDRMISPKSKASAACSSEGTAGGKGCMTPGRVALSVTEFCGARRFAPDDLRSAPPPPVSAEAAEAAPFLLVLSLFFALAVLVAAVKLLCSSLADADNLASASLSSDPHDDSSMLDAEAALARAFRGGLLGRLGRGLDSTPTAAVDVEVEAEDVARGAAARAPLLHRGNQNEKKNSVSRQQRKRSRSQQNRVQIKT